VDYLRKHEIQALREGLGLTLSELAKKLGCPVDLVVAWELGQRFPTRKHTEALLRLEAEHDEVARDDLPSPRE
jgi:DNA-binding transcriptional regulator YiaG